MDERSMTHDPEPDSHPEPATALQSQFRVGELDRTISSRRFQLTCVRWLYIPVLSIALVAMIVGLILGWGSFLPVLGGTTAVLAAVLSLSQKAGGIRDDLAELKDERDSLFAAVQPGSTGDTRQILG